MIRRFLSYWSWNYPTYLTYMLQASEYNPDEYIAWWLRTNDFRYVMKRRVLDPTQKATLIRIVLKGMYGIGVLAVGYSLYLGVRTLSLAWLFIGILLLAAWPIVMAFFVLVVVWLGELVLQRPKERRVIARASQKADTIKGWKIAIAGSYGKTSMKEMLVAVLSGRLRVRATPGNKNTLAGNSVFINSLDGSEDVVVFELGESHVGDVAALCELTQPNAGIITGITEAHLDTFGTKENLVGTVYELNDYLRGENVYKNADNQYIAERLLPNDPLAYGRSGVNGWRVSNVRSSLSGLDFVARKAEREIHVTSGLIGEHNIGPLMACIDIASRLGMTDQEIAAGVATTAAFEHRMQPYQLHGATIIDDTYNGNPIGMHSGLAVLRSAEARRRIYVTPGLVGLGDKSDMIHEAIGREIARSADVVVLMKNSTTAALRRGVEEGGFKGKLMLVGEPLEFYQHLDQFVAAGDVVLMQNDWTDNYA